MRAVFVALIVICAAARADAQESFGAWQLEAGAGAPLLWQDALGTIRDASYTADVRPRIEFRCTAGKTLAAIDWRRFISSFSTEVGFKADAGRFTWLKWKVDDSEQVTMSPSADDTAALVALLGEGERLKVEVTPYSASPVQVDFELAGLADALAALQAACN